MISLKHRGPDGAGIYFSSSKSSGLCHTRLAIQDLSVHGQQPMSTPDGRFVLAFNGEIYNKNDLISLSCAEPRGNSDTEALLLFLSHILSSSRNIESSFAAALPIINGIFAFCLYDSLYSRLYIARDRFGVKPLYYASFDGTFFFSSDLKLVPTSHTLLPDSINRYVRFQWNPGENTPFVDVLKLSPGYYQIVSDGIIESSAAWFKRPFLHPDFQLKRTTVASDQTLSLFTSAVSRQLISDVPVGAFLSGGVDSSAIVSIAAQSNPDLQCYTIKYSGQNDEGELSDFHFAQKFATYKQLNLNIVEVSPSTVSSDLVHAISYLDEPLADPAILNVYNICKCASDDSIKVLLSGVGGDDFFSGYRRHSLAKYSSLLSKLPYDFLLPLLQHPNLATASPNYRRLVKLLSVLANFRSSPFSVYQWLPVRFEQSLFTESFAKNIATSAYTPFSSYLQSDNQARTFFEDILALDQRFFLADHNLTYTDKMSMAFGVEVRVPFLDNDLTAYSHYLSQHLKHNAFHPKAVLKSALSSVLPDWIIKRPKVGFGLPLRSWINNELRDLISTVLTKRNLDKRQIFEYDTVSAIISGTHSGSIDGSYTIFSLLCLELWFQQYVDAI